MAADTSRISPTAHYTGSVWRAHGLGDPRFDGVLEHRPHAVLSPLGALVRPFLGGATLDTALLQRHLIIDHVVEAAIAEGAARVLEVPAGFSARGVRLRRAHPQVEWIDGDLAHMVTLRRAALGPSQRVEVVDLLADDGPHALARFEAPVPTVVVVEGLFNYFPTPTTVAMWARIARFLRACGPGWLVGDVALGHHVAANPLVRMFLVTLAGIARGRTQAHFDSPAEAEAAVEQAGFDAVVLHSPRARSQELGLPTPEAPDFLCVLEARVHA